MAGRYLASSAPGPDTVIHDTEHLTEECNTDQIAQDDRVRSDDIEEMLRLPNARYCLHCMAEEEPNDEYQG